MIRSKLLALSSSRDLTYSLSRSASTSSRLSSALKRHAPLDIHPEVQEALAAKKPIVALETALVTHGFQYPANIELALSLEDNVRSTGSIPATIGMIGGRIKVGMDKHELDQLAMNKRNVSKISRRDIAPAIALKADGGTTCSATLIFAALAGIKVFATGGLGGVHRGGENSMDVSADLYELTRCPVGLVSSGVKSILDIGRTLEYLESLGVPVLSYGVTREFPAFFSRHSGFDAPWNISDPGAAAEILHTQWKLGMENGALIAVPIPPEYEEVGMTIQKAVDQAVAESEETGVSKRGKDVTPWLLSRISELTGGSSLASNIALLKNTALVGGEIAVRYQDLANEQGLPSIVSTPFKAKPSSWKSTQNKTFLPPADLIIAGSAAVDITAHAGPETDNALAVHSTAPGAISMSLGGVARNIAEASHRVITSRSLSLSSLLVAPIGDDMFGSLLVDETSKFGMRVDGFVKDDKRTAVCNMILNSNGGLIGGIADMAITATLRGEAVLSHVRKHKPSIVALDGNLSPDSIRIIVKYCLEHNIKVFFEPTSVIKSASIFPAIAASLDIVKTTQAPIAFSSPNLSELVQLDQNARADSIDLISHPTWWSVIDNMSLGSRFRMDLEQLAKKDASDIDSSKGTLSFLVDHGIAQMAVKLLPFFQHLVVKCGAQGVFIAMRISGQDSLTSPWVREHTNPLRRYVVAHGNLNETVVLRHFPALPIENVVNVTGAGDSFVGALLASLAHNPLTFQDPTSLDDAIFAAQQAAILSLQTHSAVSPLLSDRQKAQIRMPLT